ncbi:MAG: hypothetical protein COB67_03620 [SAR324 cluster bacterium]|uniref:Uncharacterized protein n=1 Tax=SAR324 cluster bacterium TaxID=2024889 RepID=A0A2A4T878_9DELT|nr:MAG: hypothetical protein COB67_03620 [SAR324 cluster bacterium]
METEQTYISYLKLEQPQIWLSILRASEDGLIFVDEDHDSVTATARLLLTYPDLHEVLNMLTENWIKLKSEETGHNLLQNLLQQQ